MRRHLLLDKFAFPVLMLLAAVLFSCKTNRTSQGKTTGNTYQNPVWDHDFPDPNLVRSPDGYFYAYSTDVNWREDSMGSYVVPVLRSSDLVHWTLLGDAFSKKPGWKQDGGGIWAPDVSYYRGRYIMFYSYSFWDDPNPGIGVAVSNTPQGPFTDLGKLFYSREIGVKNSIDPFLMTDGGKPYLIWGSFNGIYGVPLSDDATRVAGDKFQIADGHFEGSYIYKRGKYYYYFGSTGTCCSGAQSTYRVQVGRALSLKGPYVDKKGKQLLEGGGSLLLKANKEEGGYLGPGHNGDIVTDDNGRTWIVYHAIAKKQPAHKNGKGTRRVMLLDEVEWVNDWPVIENGAPAVLRRQGPFFKK
jgi:arabinan endo-1,5-alpha-L-arabinosidase